MVFLRNIIALLITSKFSWRSTCVQNRDSHKLHPRKCSPPRSPHFIEYLSRFIFSLVATRNEEDLHFILMQTERQ